MQGESKQPIIEKMILVYLANNLGEDAFKKLRTAFIEIDVNRNGYICT